jgi:DnaJ family protein C protein 7
LELDPLNIQYNSAILYNRSVAYSKLDQSKEALADLTEAIAINEEYTKAYMKRAELNLVLENYQEAVRDLEKAYSIDPSVSGLKERVRHAKLELKKSLRKDYYKIMNIAKEATEEEIKKAYKK